MNLKEMCHTIREKYPNIEKSEVFKHYEDTSILGDTVKYPSAIGYFTRDSILGNELIRIFKNETNLIPADGALFQAEHPEGSKIITIEGICDNTILQILARSVQIETGFPLWDMRNVRYGAHTFIGSLLYSMNAPNADTQPSMLDKYVRALRRGDHPMIIPVSIEFENAVDSVFTTYMDLVLSDLESVLGPARPFVTQKTQLSIILLGNNRTMRYLRMNLLHMGYDITMYTATDYPCIDAH